MPGPADPLILLVEDDEADVELTLRGFADHGFRPRVEVARHGREALERLEAGLRPDLVLSDVKMPLMDGLALAHALAAHDQWSRIPLVMLTSSSEKRDRDAAAQAGARDYLVKPMELAGYGPLVERLRALLDGR